MLRTVDVWNPVPVKGHWFNLLIGYPIISNPFSGDHRIFSHSTAGFQTMEHILPMPSTKNRGSGKWPVLEVYTLSKTNHLPLKRGLPPPPKKNFQLPLFRGKVLVLGNVPKVAHFSVAMIPSPRLRRCVYHSLEAAYCIGVLPLRPTAWVFWANMTKAWQKRLPLYIAPFLTYRPTSRSWVQYSIVVCPAIVCNSL